MITAKLIEPYLPLLSTRLTLRKIEHADADSLFREYTADPEVTALTTWSSHLSVDETSAFIERCIQRWHTNEEFNLCICLNKNNTSPIGMIKIGQTNRIPSIGYVLAKKYWNQGISAEAVSTVSNWLLTLPSVSTVQAITDTENIASQKVLLNSGFQLSEILKNHQIRPQRSKKKRDSIRFVKTN